MKKIGIITIIDNSNCGNRLQNYALQNVLSNLGFDVTTIKNDKLLNDKDKYFIRYLKYLKKIFLKKNKSKNINFDKFNNKIKFTNKLYTCMSKNLNKKYDYFITGSDQVWKPTRLRMSYMDLLGFANDYKKISYAASFGIDSIDNKSKEKLRKFLPSFRAISVREEQGKKIISTACDGLECTVVLDPTFLVDVKHWRTCEVSPFLKNNKKFVFAYFLGDEQIEIVNDFCVKNNLELVNFYDTKNEFGPSEFLYLIDNAEYIFTDSFHGAVFSIIFNKQFMLFERKENSINNNMMSRMITLLNTFELNKQLFKKDFNFNINYNKVNKILEIKKEESLNYLKKVLNLK